VFNVSTKTDSPLHFCSCFSAHNLPWKFFVSFMKDGREETIFWHDSYWSKALKLTNLHLSMVWTKTIIMSLLLSLPTFIEKKFKNLTPRQLWSKRGSRSDGRGREGEKWGNKTQVSAKTILSIYIIFFACIKSKLAESVNLQKLSMSTLKNTSLLTAWCWLKIKQGFVEKVVVGFELDSW
jgi:hypothetical protein